MIPGKVIKKAGPLSYVINVGPGLDWKRHVDNIMEANSEPLPETTAQDSSEDQCIDITPYTDNNYSNVTAIEESSTSISDEPRRYPTRQHQQPDRYM